MSAKKQTKKAVAKKVPKKAVKKTVKKTVAKKPSAKKAAKKKPEAAPIKTNIVSLADVSAPAGLGEKISKYLSQIPPGTGDKLMALLISQGPTAFRAGLDLAIAKSKPGKLKFALTALRTVAGRAK